MQALMSLFAEHGLLALFLGVLTEQLGSPLPSLPFLLLAGAQASDGRLSAWQALAVAALAAGLANSLWFLLGRRLGRRVLTTLCRISISPDSCVRQNELSFARRGAQTLLLAKFVPGLTVLAPPLAGALGLGWRHFLTYNLAGSLLWAGAGLASGWLFHAQIDGLLAALDGLGQIALGVGTGLLAAYVGWRLWRRWRLRRLHQGLSRMTPDALAARLHAAAGQGLLVVDVRASAPELPVQSRIPGAVHLDMSRLDPAAIAGWPADIELVTYCACPNDASAAKAARWLVDQGRSASVLAGGIEAWIGAGHALEALPGAEGLMPTSA
jgi:membrane protein DedA with SNARE-associated domain/rhodanese-related sulfurtransferase